MSPQPAGNLASFPEEPFHFGFHVQAPMTESDPFVLRSPRTVATPANTSFPASFKWTVPTNPREESHILDRSGNPVYTIRSPSRRKTTISDEYGDVVAKMKWPGRPFMTAPTVRLNRDIPMRIKDWIRFCPSMQYVLSLINRRVGGLGLILVPLFFSCRSILLRGDTYYLTETGEGSTQIFKNGHEDDDRVGIITVGHGGVSLDIIPTLLVLLEEFVIIATILSVSQNSNMRIWGSKLGELGDVRIVHRGDN
ncbi:hypothetical protein DL93DRAFT_2073143 [Clavulina sp. PMI_390]|nr:hypothetical protein DL93DRAFT_2073143 [Clavulina sp. PMI_390]